MRRGSQTVRQRSAKSRKSVRLRSTPPFFLPESGQKNMKPVRASPHTASAVLHILQRAAKCFIRRQACFIKTNRVQFCLSRYSLYTPEFLCKRSLPFCGFCAITVSPRKVFSQISNCLISPFFTPYNIAGQVCHCIV